ATISNLTIAGTYTVVVTAATGCTSTCTRALTVNQKPSCDITGNNLICADGSASFTATGRGSYAWTGPVGFAPATGATISNLTLAGTYTVVVTATTGCTSTCTRTLTVVENPIIYVPVATPFCAGNPAKGTVTLPNSQTGVNYT